MQILNFLSSLFPKKAKGNIGENNSTTDPKEMYATFDKTKHLLPNFERLKFDSVHGWEFGWAILELINIAKSKDEEPELSKRFSPGQKALYFFWYLDAQVTNGGFIQFYWNGYDKYLPPIIEGLKLIGDNQTIELISKADHEFRSNLKLFIDQKKKDDSEPLYEKLEKFDELDEAYYEHHNKTMDLIEAYARQNPNEFVKLI